MIASIIFSPECCQISRVFLAANAQMCLRQITDSETSKILKQITPVWNFEACVCAIFPTLLLRLLAMGADLWPRTAQKIFRKPASVSYLLILVHNILLLKNTPFFGYLVLFLYCQTPIFSDSLQMLFLC